MSSNLAGRASNLNVLAKDSAAPAGSMSAECPRNLFGARSQRHLEAPPLELSTQIVRPANAICAACRLPFTPRRSTALFCSPRCRKAAQRARDRGTPISVPVTRPGVGQDAVLSVTATDGMSERQKSQSVTLRSKLPKLDPRLVPEPKWPWMYRIKRRDGSLTDMLSLTRAKDALL